MEALLKPFGHTDVKAIVDKEALSGLDGLHDRVKDTIMEILHKDGDYSAVHARVKAWVNQLCNAEIEGKEVTFEGKLEEDLDMEYL